MKIECLPLVQTAMAPTFNPALKLPDAQDQAGSTSSKNWHDLSEAREASSGDIQAQKQAIFPASCPAVLKILRDEFDLPRDCESRVSSLLRMLSEYFGSFENLANKRILDLGCGASVTTSFPSRWESEASSDPKIWEPWMCRALLAIGARPFGVDIGDLSSEKFEYLNADLTDPKALSKLPDKSFDAAVICFVCGSPSLRLDFHERTAMMLRIVKECSRLLNVSGVIVGYDSGMDLGLYRRDEFDREDFIKA